MNEREVTVAWNTDVGTETFQHVVEHFTADYIKKLR